MADQRKIVINQLHELNILLLHSKLKATRARTARRAAATVRNVDAARRAAATVRNVDAARRGRPLMRPIKEQTESALRMFDCLNPDELSTLSEYLQRIIDNTDTRLLDEEITERRKAIHEFLMLDRSGTEAQE